ncbi:hypothetical protein FRB98_003591 [Tulasnella sp. 332]|nr:hypothetical protein FRB98_003591 [Tulasnella sp. 332]
MMIFYDSTSYDRYNEGRKDFGAMTSTIRTLTRLIWVQVNLPLPPDNRKNDATAFSSIFRPASDGTGSVTLDDSVVRERAMAEDRMTAEKIRVMKLILSFMFAVVHYLRNEPGIDWKDFEGVLPDDFKHKAIELGTGDAPQLLNRYATHAAIDRGRLGHKPTTHRHGASFQKRKKGSATEGHEEIEPSATTPLLGDDHTTVEFRSHETPASLPLPLIIATEVSRILYKFRRRGYIDAIGPSGFTTMSNCWRMVPLVTLVAFTLMGIEGIADAIESPFGKHAADLPLDRFCEALRSEVEYMIERMPQGPEGDIDPFDA